MINDKFVFLAFAINMIGIVIYMAAMLKGKAKPNRVSFAMWSIAPLIGFAGQLSKGVGVQSLLTLSVGLGPLLVVLLSFFVKQSYWKLVKLDYAFGLLALLGIVLWQLTNNGLYAIIFAISADALAAAPTIIKSLKHPETENATNFGLGVIASLITLLTIKRWTFEEYGFSLYIMLICMVFFVLIQFKVGERFKSERS